MHALFINLYRRFSSPGALGVDQEFVGSSHSESHGAGLPIIDIERVGTGHSEAHSAGINASTGEVVFGSGHSESHSTGVSESENLKVGAGHSDSHSAGVNESTGIVIIVEAGGRRKGGGFAHRYPNVAATDPGRLAELKRENAELAKEIELLRAEMAGTAGPALAMADLSDEEHALLMMMLDDEQ